MKDQRRNNELYRKTEQEKACDETFQAWVMLGCLIGMVAMITISAFN